MSACLSALAVFFALGSHLVSLHHNGLHVNHASVIGSPHPHHRDCVPDPPRSRDLHLQHRLGLRFHYCCVDEVWYIPHCKHWVLVPAVSPSGFHCRHPAHLHLVGSQVSSLAHRPGREEEARAILVKYHCNGDENGPLVDFEFNEICAAIQAEKDNAKSSSLKELFTTRPNFRRLRVYMALAIEGQWSGFSVI